MPYSSSLTDKEWEVLEPLLPDVLPQKKRTLAVDTLGFPFFTHCTPANVSDDNGLIEMLTEHIDYFRAKPVNIPKITVLLDHGYHPDKLTEALEEVYPKIMNKIRFEGLVQDRVTL